MNIPTTDQQWKEWLEAKAAVVFADVRSRVPFTLNPQQVAFITTACFNAVVAGAGVVEGFRQEGYDTAPAFSVKPKNLTY